MTGRNWISAAILVVAMAPPQQAAADYWRYETETGGVAFTDDPKNIPAKYQAGARAVEEASLFDYSRLSVVEPRANAVPTHGGVAPRDASADAFAYPVSESGAAGRVGRSGSRVSVNVGGMQIDVEGGADDDEPLYVDRSQYNDLNGDFIDHNGIMSPTTIIRRGDKPIAYIDER